jgi:hypothetical protein
VRPNQRLHLTARGFGFTCSVSRRHQRFVQATSLRSGRRSVYRGARRAAGEPPAVMRLEDDGPDRRPLCCVPIPSFSLRAFRIGVVPRLCFVRLRSGGPRRFRQNTVWSGGDRRLGCACCLIRRLHAGNWLAVVCALSELRRQLLQPIRRVWSLLEPWAVGLVLASAQMRTVRVSIQASRLA